MMKLLRIKQGSETKSSRPPITRALLAVAAMIGVLMAGEVPASATAPTSITVEDNGRGIQVVFPRFVCSGNWGTCTADKDLFAVSANGQPKAISSVDLSYDKVGIVLTTSDKIPAAATVVVTYTAPGGLSQGGLEFVTDVSQNTISPELVPSIDSTFPVTNNSTVDLTPPALNVDFPPLVSEDLQSIVLTFTERLSQATAPTGSLTVTENGTPVPVQTLTVSDATATLSAATLRLQTPVSPSATVTVAYTQPDPPEGWADLDNNRMLSFAATQAGFAPQRAPELDGGTVPRLDTNGIHLFLTFDETLAPTVPAASAFTVTVGASPATVSFVQNTGSTTRLTVDPVVLQGETVKVSYTAPVSGGLQDVAGNPAASFTELSVTNNSTQVNDVTPPSLGSPAAAIASNGTELTLFFDEALAATVPAASAFTVTVDGSPLAVSSVANSGQNSVLTLASPVFRTATSVKVSYVAPGSGGLQDAAGNPVVSFTDRSVNNSSTQVPPPVVEAASLQANGTSLTLRFSTYMDYRYKPTSAFTLTVGGSTVTVSSMSIGDFNVTLGLASTVPMGATVTLSYVAPVSGGLQSESGFGGLVLSFTDFPVTNGSTQPAPTTTTTTPPTTTAPPSSGTPVAPTAPPSPTTTTTPPSAATPSRVTPDNQGELTAEVGSAKATINGEDVTLTLTSASAETAGATAPEERTSEQVSTLQRTATDIVTVLDVAAGGDSGLEVIDTDTGAEIEGIFDDVRVPVENVVVARSGAFAGVYASLDANGQPVQVQSRVLEMVRGGEVAVIVYGLPAGEEVELVLMSTPVLLGRVTADSSGNFTRRLGPPDMVANGEHTLVTASDSIVVSLGIRITEVPSRPTPGELVLPVTGRELPIAPLLVIGLGSILVGISRRRTWTIH